MCPNHYQNQMLAEAKAQSEALARIEAEQLRQAKLLDGIVERLEVAASGRTQRSASKP